MEVKRTLLSKVSRLKNLNFEGQSGSEIFDEIEELFFKYERLKQEFELFQTHQNSNIIESVTWFQEIFNSTNEAILIHDSVDGRILDINTHGVKMYGYHLKSEMLNLRVKDISSNIEPYSETAISKIIKKAVTEGPQQFQWQAKKKDQSIFWVDVSLKSSSINGQKLILAVVKDIDYRKKTDDALLESERFLRETQEIAKLGTYVLDIPTGVWRCSSMLDEIFGILPNQERTVELWSKILHPNCAAEMNDYFANEVVGKGHPFDREYQIVRVKDHAERWVHGLGKLVFNTEGKPIQMIGTIRDITERKHSEEILKKTETRQSALIANISDVIAIIDVEGKINYKSPNLEKWFGWKSTEVIGHSAWELVHPDDIAKTQNVFEEVLSGDKIVKKSECRYLCKNGKYRWIEYTAINLIENPIINGVLINYHDITEQKSADEALRIEQKFSKTILDSLPGIFYFYSYPELELKIWNKNHEILLGFTSDEMKNRSLFDWHLPENKAGVKAAVDYAMNYGQNAIEANLLAKDGTQIPFLLTGVRFEAQGKLYLMGVGIDATEQKKNEEMLRKKSEEIEVQNEEYMQLNEELIQTNDELLAAKERAEESDRLKTAFLQNMSHEIRTPMNAIMGFSELMAGAYNDKEKLEYFSNIINRRCNDLLAIINDILDIAKIESGQLNVINEKCDLQTLFLELKVFYNEYQKRIKKEHIEFELIIADEFAKSPIIADIVKLKQILINLISNAFKYTETGKISCTCKIQNEMVVFSIKDTGIGIPREKHQYIFERFVQAHQDRKIIGGTGLGLAIVKGLLNLLNGKISVESEPGHGSTFTFQIPYTKYQSIGKQQEIDNLYQKDVNLRGHSVLIVEDELYNTVYLEEILNAYQLLIYTAMQGNEAIHLVQQQKVDLILMDIRLPDMSGYEVTEQIKKLYPGIKIIALTAYAAPEDRIKALKAGCCDYLSKPVKKVDLINMISKHLPS